MRSKVTMALFFLKCAWAVWRGHFLTVYIRWTFNRIEIELIADNKYAELFRTIGDE